MKTIAQVILIRHDGSLVLQHSEGSDLVTPFGGPIEAYETPRDAAASILAELTNLRITPEDAVYLRQYPKIAPEGQPNQRVFYFTVHYVYNHQTTRHHAVIVQTSPKRKINVSPLFRRVLTDYFHDLRLHRHIQS
jgi:ADP-ribose pyrophosphatase YjhB (NUDIX family)